MASGWYLPYLTKFSEIWAASSRIVARFLRSGTSEG